MVVNYFKVAVRALLRNRIHSLLSVLGLAIGLGIGMVSISYVVRELSWEDCHENHDRIFRVEMQYHYADSAWSSARIMAPLAGTLAEDIPGVEKAAVFRRARNVSMKIGNNTYSAGNLLYAQPDFFEVFTFPLKTGDSRTALRTPYSVLITDSIAGVYFPDKDPIGKTVVLNDEAEYTITGVLEDVPPLTQLHCDFVASYSTLNRIGANVDSWTGAEDYAYLLLDDQADANSIAAHIPHVFSLNVTDDTFQRYTFSLKPLKDIYFSTYYSGNKGEIWPGGEYDVTIMIILLAVFILLIAIINFISLSTAAASDRMAEVGVRKTFGASRSRLLVQFLGESMILTFVATLLGMLFYDIFSNGYSAVAPDPYELVPLYGDPGAIGLIAALAVFTGLLAGFYPAVCLSGFKPISILRARTASSPRRSVFRKILTAIQFTLAIFFIIVAVGFQKQLDLITHYDLGFNRDNIMVLRFHDAETGGRECIRAKQEILARNDVLGAAGTDAVLGTRIGYTYFYTDSERKEADRKYPLKYVVDQDFLSLYGINLVEGRWFARAQPEDADHAILISKSMKKQLGWDNPIGRRLYTDSSSYEIIGVVENFHGAAFRASYGSTAVIFLDPDQCRVLCIKLKPDDISGSIAAIKTTWEDVFDNRLFTYSFLDDEIRAEYEELDSMVKLFGSISVISIIVAGMGIFGLVLYTVKQKTKETAIRKILGASLATILKYLTKEFVYLIAIANAFACPLAYLTMNPYLQEFPIRVSPGIDTYLSGGVLTLIIALALSGYHVVRAARANPTDALRYQ